MSFWLKGNTEEQRDEMVDELARAANARINPLPCPFCGADAIIETGAWAGEKRPPKFVVRCSTCTVQGGAFSSQVEALIEWNRRV